MKRLRSVYLDYAAATPVEKRVFEAMRPYFSRHYANPSALYAEAQAAGGALNDSRRTIAEILHALPDNVIFTSGGTEANNLALFGTARAHDQRGKHIITTAIEHHAVLEPAARLKKEGWKITVLPVDSNGLVKARDVIKAVRPDTVIISVMYANNEIGAVQPIAEIGRRLMRYRKERGTAYPFFHTDACQAAGYLDLNVEKLHLDLMSVNASKIYGPKGAGFLYVRRGVALAPLLSGGGQERNLRAGTENVPGAVGLAKALDIVQRARERENKRIEELVKYFWRKLQKAVPNAELNGPEIGEERLPNNLNVIFPGISGEALIIYLDSSGIMCSTGSACSAMARESSHVLKAIGKTPAQILSGVRFTLGRETTKRDIVYTFQSLPKALKLAAKASG